MPDTTIVSADGDFSAYLATLVGSTHPGVLCIREIFGVYHAFTRIDSIHYDADTANPGRFYCDVELIETTKTGL